jgi:AcrR family transcriptional regulator
MATLERHVARTGRRPGRSNAREDILRSAVHQFGTHGLAGATLRGIAAEAGADPALIRHYFGSKNGLFRASVGSVLSVGDALDLAQPAGPELLADLVARHFLGLVGGPGRPGPLIGLIRAAVTDRRAAELLRRHLLDHVLARLAAAIAETGSPTEAEERAARCGSQLIGFAIARNVLEIDPLARLDEDAAARLLAQALHHHLTAPASGASTPTKGA